MLLARRVLTDRFPGDSRESLRYSSSGLDWIGLRQSKVRACEISFRTEMAIAFAQPFMDYLSALWVGQGLAIDRRASESQIHGCVLCRAMCPTFLIGSKFSRFGLLGWSQFLRFSGFGSLGCVKIREFEASRKPAILERWLSQR